MTIELKTGKKGELHISSEDDRLLHCRSFGTGAYVLSGCAVTMTSANKAHIAEGELMVQGGYVRITGGGEDVAIANGVAGQKRNTIIALTYTRDSNGIEAMSFAAVDGSSIAGTPSDPIVTTNDINAGASSSMWKFARIQLDGLTVGTPQILFATKAAALLDQISSLSSQVASLQDSVSPKTLVDGQIKSGESRTVHGIADWLIVGVYASAAAGDSDDREMLIPCLVGDRFLLGSSGCAVDGSNPRYVSVRFLLNGEVLKYVNVTMQDVENGNILNSRNANGVVGLIRR